MSNFQDLTEVGFIEVSHEMTLLLGPGRVGRAVRPRNAVAIRFDVCSARPVMTVENKPDLRANTEFGDGLVILICRKAFKRVGGIAACGAYHLPGELRAIVMAIYNCRHGGEACKVYRLGKSIELLCETIRIQIDGALTPVATNGMLSLEDSQRLIAARRMIDERWAEKLTLDKIARDCGLNRAKLTSGFRSMFNCSVAEAISERRLKQAQTMLLTTDLPVSCVGYENGYMNNASFARAFARRFGMPPTDYRNGHGAFA